MDVCRLAEGLPPDALAGAFAYAALELVDEGRVGEALRLLRAARAMGVVDPGLESLAERLAAVLDLRAKAGRVEEALRRVVEGLARGRVAAGDVARLEAAVAEAMEAVRRARGLGLEVDDSGLRYAGDVAAIARAYLAAQDAAARLRGTLFHLQNLLQRLSQAETLAEYANLLASMEAVNRGAVEAAGRLEAALRALRSAQLSTPQGRELAEALAAGLQGMLEVARLASRLSAHAAALGASLRRILYYVENYARSPQESPFAAGAAGFHAAAVAALQAARQLQLVEAPEGLPEGAREAAEALAEAARGIGSSAILVLRNLKYATTFADYRWNKAWEQAEAAAGVDLGSITAADTQRYVFRGCTEEGCRLEPRRGIVERLPEEALEVAVAAEAAIRMLEEANRWVMRYAKSPLARAAGHVGYLGAQLLSMPMSLLAPRVLMEGLRGLAELAGKWKQAIEEGSGSLAREAARETFRAFFGSREAILTTLAGALLGYAAMKLPIQNVFLRALAEAALTGDPLGPLLAPVVAKVRLARAAGTTVRLIREGAVRVGDILDEAGIAEAAKRAAARAKLPAARQAAGALSRLLARAAREAGSLNKARSRLQELIRAEGLSGLQKMLEEWKAAEAAIAGEVHARLQSRLPARLRRALARAAREHLEAAESIEERLPQALRRAAEAGGLPPEAARVIEKLEEAAAAFEKHGALATAAALRELAGTLRAAAGRHARLQALQEAVEALLGLASKAEARGLWAEAVELSRRRLKPGRGWLRRVRVAPAEALERARSLVAEQRGAAEARLRSVLEALERELSKAEAVGPGAMAFDRLARRVAEALEKAGFTEEAARIREALSEVALEAAAGRVPRDVLSARLVEAVRRALEPAAEPGLAERLRLSKAYKAVLEALEAFRATPIGALLRDLEGYLRTRIEAVEAAARRVPVEELVARAVAEELARSGAGRELARLLSRVTEAYEELRRAVGEETARLLDSLLARARGSPRELARAAVEFLEEEGVEVTPQLAETVERYVAAATAKRALEELVSLSQQGRLPLSRAQELVDALVEAAPMLAWRVDWAALKATIESLVSAARAAVEAVGAPEAQAEIVRGMARSAAELEAPTTTPFEKVHVERELPLHASRLAETIQRLVDRLAEAYGDKAVAGLREMARELAEQAAEGRIDPGLLRKMRRELLKLRLLHPATTIKAALASAAEAIRGLALRLAESMGGGEAALLAQAARDLADIIEELGEAELEGKGWAAVARELEVLEGEVITGPSEVRRDLARIIAEGERTWTVETASGYEVRVTRRIEVDPLKGRMVVRYRFEGPGGRWVELVEAAEGTPEGRVKVYRQLVYDPELEALLAGGAGVEAARALAEALGMGLEKIDPDYAVLARVKLAPAGAGTLASVIEAGLRAAAAGLAALAAGTLLEAQEALAEAVERAARGEAEPGDLALLSLAGPVAESLGPAYERLRPIPEEVRRRIEELTGGAYWVPAGEAGVRVRLPPAWPETATPYLVMPGGLDYYLAAARQGEVVEATLPSGATVYLPAILVSPTVAAVLLPPIAIQLPDWLREALADLGVPAEAEVQLQAQPQAPATKPIPPPPPTTTQKTPAGGAAGLPPLYPASVPWLAGLAPLSGARERERLAI